MGDMTFHHPLRVSFKGSLFISSFATIGHMTPFLLDFPRTVRVHRSVGSTTSAMGCDVQCYSAGEQAN